MITGPEATIVARAGGSLVRGLREEVTTEPQWPSLHEGLLELFAIISAWCDAADETERLIQQKLSGVSGRSGRALNWGDGVVLGHSNVGIISDLTAQVDQQLNPKAPLVKRLVPEQRRQAARRTLRNLMAIYCPDLLASFAEATDQRREWVESNRAALKKALAAQEVDRDALRQWAAEAGATKERLISVREDLAALIREKYPMG
ncbi:hypothetical protein ACFWXO_38885 [Kitasatospora sp. NPDC059088]|uniref:hypothetical protein n=1 Tax=Kitasatospora sp. NPDC059088 TaxID=3346722 RepID=UPI0036BC7BFB